LSFLPFQVSSCTTSNFRDFITNEWFPIYSTSIHWIIRFGCNAGVLSQVTIEATNSSLV